MTSYSCDFPISILSSPSLSFPPALLVSVLDFFNVQVLFLTLHTLINEFFLFSSFSTLAYSPFRRSLPRDYHDFLLFFLPSKVPTLILVFFSGNREQSRHSTLLVDASQLLAFCHSFWTHELFPFCWQPFSLMSKRPHSFPSHHALALHHGHSVLARVCVNKIPDKPANLFAGNCPQILAGEIKFPWLRANAKFRGPLCRVDRCRILFSLHFASFSRTWPKLFWSIWNARAQFYNLYRR